MVSVSQVPALTTTHQVQSQSQPQGTVVVQQTGANVIQSPAQRNDNAKEKCRKFLTNLIDLSKREPAQVEMNVKTLIQELVDANVGPEDFCKKLENLLNAAPQPCLVGFLKVRELDYFELLGIERLNIFFCLTEKSSTPQTVSGDERDDHRGNQSTESQRRLLRSHDYDSTDTSECSLRGVKLRNLIKRAPKLRNSIHRAPKTHKTPLFRPKYVP